MLGLQAHARSAMSAQGHERLGLSYGFSIALPFREGIDPEAKAYVSPFDSNKLCKDRLRWLYRKVCCSV